MDTRLASLFLVLCFAAALPPGVSAAVSELAEPSEIPGTDHVRTFDGCDVLVYRSCGRPLIPTSSPGGQSRTRAIQKPEPDATSCMPPAQLSDGDPLIGFGNHVLANRCGQAMEVFRCKDGRYACMGS
ncbi:MAG: hypothetical protein J0L89_10725 [Xanthomonadales bacterium]|nr:hypothetical protein [Xanthomonadales bacterium]